MQLIDRQYKRKAANNVLRFEVQYAPRGEVVDRNGNYIVQNKECYDLMVVWREMDKAGFDTLKLCNVLGMSKEKMVRALKNARMTPRAPYRVKSYVSQESKLRFDEHNYMGFYTIKRTVRQYPRNIGGNLLGNLGEVNDRDIKQGGGEYKLGDYIGRSGLERAYEEYLRGEDGVKILERDAHGAIKGSYMDGMYDTLPIPGKKLISTIDVKLQAFAEELMRGKIGAVVAIEPSTGEILVMASSPTFDPNDMVGSERGNNYMRMIHDVQKPMFNRAVQSKYPPGSTFKLVQGLIGMQEGVLTPADAYPCHEGYKYGRKKMGCHPHSSPLDLRNAVAQSCNAYFCYVFRDIIDNKKYTSVKEGLDRWVDYVNAFGYGRKLGSDFLDEQRGFVPNTEFYDKVYHGSWNSFTVLSLSIGQGELGCTPLQMANLAAIVANRGYYYIPHIVKGIEDQDSIDRRFYQKQYVGIDAKHFEPIVEGMWKGVNIEGAGTSYRAHLPGWDVCGKTGTAQNPNCKDHSTFLSFAPKNNPKIAISVYVEHGGYGSAAALPIASLIEEMYLTGKISRPQLVQQVKNLPYHLPKKYQNAKKK
jgi:penicillin-binding protein 2